MVKVRRCESVIWLVVPEDVYVPFRVSERRFGSFCRKERGSSVWTRNATCVS